MLLSWKMAWYRPQFIFYFPVYISFFVLLVPLVLQQCEKQGVENNFILTGEQHRYRRLTHFRAANLLKNLEQYSAQCLHYVWVRYSSIDPLITLCTGWSRDRYFKTLFFPPPDHQQKRVINFVLSYLIDFMDQSKIIFG